MKALSPFGRSDEKISVEFDAEVKDKELLISFGLSGETHLVKIPPVSRVRKKAEGLYEATCFEVFILGESGAYGEWNFSPSGDWCTFQFEGYRKRREDNLGEKSFSKAQYETSGKPSFCASLDLKVIQEALGAEKLKLNPAVVVEYVDGKKDYFTLRHFGEKPDFHDPRGFLIDV